MLDRTVQTNSFSLYSLAPGLAIVVITILGWCSEMIRVE